MTLSRGLICLIWLHVTVKQALTEVIAKEMEGCGLDFSDGRLYVPDKELYLDPNAKLKDYAQILASVVRERRLRRIFGLRNQQIVTQLMLFPIQKYTFTLIELGLIISGFHWLCAKFQDRESRADDVPDNWRCGSGSCCDSLGCVQEVPEVTDLPPTERCARSVCIEYFNVSHDFYWIVILLITSQPSPALPTGDTTLCPSKDPLLVLCQPHFLTPLFSVGFLWHVDTRQHVIRLCWAASSVVSLSENREGLQRTLRKQ